jgi:WD40 repeat protein
MAITTQALLRSATRHWDFKQTFEATPMGRGFVAITLDGLCIVEDTLQEKIYEVPFDVRVVCSVSRDTFLSSNPDNTLGLWQVQNGEVASVWSVKYEGPGGKPITTLCRLTDKYFICGHANCGTLSLWNLEDVICEAVWEAIDSEAMYIYPLPNSRVVCCSFKDSVTVWDYLNQRLLFSIGPNNSQIYDVCLHPALGLVLANKQRLSVYNTDTFTFIQDIPIKGTTGLIKLSANLLALRTSGKHIRILNCTTLAWEELTVEFSESWDGWTKLNNGNLVINATKGFTILDFVGIEWQRIFKWLFLAQTDGLSVFFGLPTEAIFHIVEITEDLDIIDI